MRRTLLDFNNSNHQKWLEIVDNLPVGLMVKNQIDGKIIYANQFLKHLLNISDDALLSLEPERLPKALFPLSEQEYEKLIRYESILEPFKACLKVREYPEMWLECFVSYDTNGSIIELFVDITGETLLKKMLERRTQELETFAKILSHDIKGALFTFKGYASLVDVKDLPENIAKFFAGIQRSAEKLSRIVESCLDYYKACKADPQTKPVDLEKVTKEELSHYIQDIDACRGLLIFESEPCVAILDRSFFSIIFRNLITNAIKFRSPDRALSIHVNIRKQSKWATLSITDNGRGLTEEQVKNLFSPFVRHHSGTEGTGLGLSIVRNLVERLGGEIQCKKNEGPGLTFVVKFLSAE